MKFRSNLKPSPSLIDLTPLVDVIFLLLIFFMITSDILPFKSLNIESPQLEKDSAALTTQLLLVMDAQHVIYLGSKKRIVDLGSLKEHVQQEIARLKQQNGGHEPTIVLNIDRRVDYGVFFKLFAHVQECCSHIRLVYQPTEFSEPLIE